MIARARNQRRDFADACLRCAHDGAAPAPTRPQTVHVDGLGDVVASYRCRHGHTWSTWWSLELDSASRGSASPRVTIPAPEAGTR